MLVILMLKPIEWNLRSFISIPDMSLYSLDTPASALRDGDDVEDARLMRAIANGDRDAFRQLHDRHEGLLFTTIHKVLNDRADTEEVMQETLFNLWRKACLYTPGRGRPVTWIASLARNRAIDRLRAKQRQARLRDALEVDDTRHIAAQVTIDAAEVSSRRDDCIAVRRAVVDLTDCQREAIEMAFFQDMSREEIAARLGEPIGTVKARIRRGIRRLRAHFDVSGDNDPTG